MSGYTTAARSGSVSAPGLPVAHRPAAARHPHSSARPAATGHARAGGGGSAQANRAIAKQKWQKIFGGFAYLEAGPTNRLVLSIRSGVLPDVDFALERLIQISGFDPDLLRFSELPGLLPGLVELVRSFIDSRLDRRRRGTLALDEIWRTTETDHDRRRALEAALVLRNLALEGTNHKGLFASKKLLPLLADALEEGIREGSDDLSELVVYLLEVLDVMAPHTPLEPTRVLEASQPSSLVDMAPPAARIFPTLVALTRSADRALVIGAFRCLTSLSINGASDMVLALATYEANAATAASTSTSTSTLSQSHPHPVHTAIELLPIADAELGTVVLDYIYQHTLLPANAVLFAARPDLLQVLRLVCLKLHLGARKETVQVSLPVKDGPAEAWRKSQPARHRRRAKPYARKVSDLSAVLDAEQSARLSDLDEPSRTAEWMRTVFEANATAEITQVALWQAYRAQFEPVVQKGGPPMLTASELIKKASQLFPGALAMVVEQPERKFIIRGIRLKDRPDMRTVYICRWQDCPAPFGYDSASTLYWHVHRTHCNPATAPKRCGWATCTYEPADASSASSTEPAYAISLHMRTHLPTYHPPPTYGNPPTPLDPTAPLPGPPAPRLVHHRYHAQLDSEGELTGQGYLACLVLRNVARTVKIAVESGGASVLALTEGGSSVLASLASAAVADMDGVDATTTTTTAGAATMEVELETVDYKPARKGALALMDLEDRLVGVVMEDHGLGKMLGEVVSIAVECSKRVKEKGELEGVDGSASTGGEEAADVLSDGRKMQINT